MSETASPESAAPVEWPALGPSERRVLGVLVEKSKTTPDVYPMSINGLVTGCNQKSNRDPIMNLDEGQVEEVLTDLQKAMLVIRITGSGRVDKWRHNLYESWRVEKVELAILTELLLRGPQTEGELRGRASRMEPIPDLDALRNALRPMQDRKLVVYLTPEGKRGTIVTHGFHLPGELEGLRAGAVSHDAAEPRALSSRASAAAGAASVLGAEAEARLAQVESNMAELKAELEVLRAALADVARVTKNTQNQDGTA